MRATQDGEEWQDTWVAGFASRCLGHHWLFYLAKIVHVCESQFDFWRLLRTKPKRVREEKCSLNDPFGDLFKPKGTLKGDERFDPSCYHAPQPGHAHHSDGCDNAWTNDIRYRKAHRYCRQPSLLVGDPSLSFLWQRPKLRLNEFHPRNFVVWDTISKFLAALGEER
jgi:hypothetical protein